MAETITYRNALPLPSLLLEYRLESVLGAGAFGMTYSVGIRSRKARRDQGNCRPRAVRAPRRVVPITTEHGYNYQWGLDRFIQEARTLARFSHPNIVRVNRYFEANGTGYMVMDYENGESLWQLLKRAPRPGESQLRAMLMPLLDGLEAVHEAGFLHRDIKPSNVFIRENGVPVLLDFGAARQAIGGATKSLTSILTPGYAPLEQYSSDGHQGPWSDMLLLRGTVPRIVTRARRMAVSRCAAMSSQRSSFRARPDERRVSRCAAAVPGGRPRGDRVAEQCAEWRRASARRNADTRAPGSRRPRYHGECGRHHGSPVAAGSCPASGKGPAGAAPTCVATARAGSLLLALGWSGPRPARGIRIGGGLEQAAPARQDCRRAGDKGGRRGARNAQAATQAGCSIRTTAAGRSTRSGTTAARTRGPARGGKRRRSAAAANRAGVPWRG